MKILRKRPPCFLRRLFSICLVIVFSACATSEKNGTGQRKQDSGDVSLAKSGTITFINKTNFTVHLVRGSGRVDAASITPGASLNIPNTFEEAEDYYPLFDIPLTDSYSLSRLKPRDIDFYYRIDNKITRQEIEIHVPPDLSDTSASYTPVYIIFTNRNNKTGGVSLSRNVSRNQMTGINFIESKSNININETMVFRENPRDLQNLRLNPINVSFGEMAYQAGFVYSFVFDESGVNLTDSRPLHRVGESGWAQPLPITTARASTPLLTSDGNIQLFAPVGNGVTRYAYDSGGNKKAEVRNGDVFQVVSAVQAGNEYFIAGYEKKGDRFFPIARIHNTDGTARRLLSPSNRPEYYSAFYKTAAHKDDTWLVAGGAKAIGDHDSFAYVRLVRDNGSALASSWELGKKEFNDFLKITDQSPMNIARCGEIRCAVYDPGRNRWLLSGENLEYDTMFSPITGSYLAIIGNDGRIQKIDTSFKGMSFYKILLDEEGNYYLAGEEEKGRDTLAVIIKYNSDGKKLMQNIAPPLSHSWYQDAILDIENGQIVLGGTMQAADEYGNKGIPFIEALSLEKLELLWQTPLKDATFGKAALVTAVVPAPDYGFAITLSGIDDGYIDQPYLIARVNARGKLLK